MKKLLIAVIIIVPVVILISFISLAASKYKNYNCYEKCSDYHLLSEATHWNYNDFVIDNGDTIWVDKECYNDWCICIDECKAGLCCEFLR